MGRAALLGVCTAIGIALLVAAYGRSSSAAGGARPADAPVHGNFSLPEARELGGPAVYFAGTSVAGLPLTAVESGDDEAGYVSFLYGDCRAEDHRGCALPLEIQSWPACQRNLSLYDASDPFAPKPERSPIRGVPAGILDDGRQLELQTGDTTVVIFGESRALVNRAAAALRSVANGADPGDPLRPPVPAVEGALACPRAGSG